MQGVSRKIIAVCGMLVVAAVFAVLVVPRAPTTPAPAGEGRAAPPSPLIDAIERAHGVRVAVDAIPASTWPGVTFRPLEARDAHHRDRYLRQLRAELDLYPRAFLARSGLRAVAVVKDLAYAGQQRSAVPDPYKGVLYLDATCAAHDAQYERHVIHHEYFHFIQGARYGTPYRIDPTWQSFNPPGFRYGKGGATTRDARVTPLTHPAPGFINLYAQSALEEDMAEVFAALRVPAERKLIERWAREDEVLGKKIAYLEAFFDEYGRGDVAASPPASVGAR